jgi:hypothetical protein
MVAKHAPQSLSGTIGFLPEPFPKPRLKHAWRGKTLAERRRWDENIFIPHPQARTAVQDVLNNIGFTLDAAKSIAMLMVAESGRGKTTLRRELVRQVMIRFARENGEVTIVPALALDVPAKCTPAEFCYAILRALGDPMQRRRDTSELTKVTADLIMKCGVRVVLLDNIQDIPSSRRERGIEQVGLRLRDLIDLTACVWVLLGTKEARAVINNAAQLTRRVLYETQLEEFGIDSLDQRKRFLTLLIEIDCWLPLAESSVELLRACAGEIFIATNGIFDYINKLLGRACDVAVSFQREHLTKSDLSAAFSMLYRSRGENPFDDGFVARPLTRRGEPFEALASEERTSKRSASKQAREVAA